VDERTTALELLRKAWAVGPIISAVGSSVSFFNKITGSEERVEQARKRIARIHEDKRARKTAEFFLDWARC
jgi:hypothetical protein